MRELRKQKKQINKIISVAQAQQFAIKRNFGSSGNDVSRDNISEDEELGALQRPKSNVYSQKARIGLK